MVWYFIGVYIINGTLHGLLEIRNFSSRVEKTLEEKFRISARPSNILYLINARISVLNSLNTLLIYYLGFVVHFYCFATM